MSVRAKQSWSRRAAYAGAVLATTALAIGITPRPAEAQYPYGYPAGTSSHYPNSYNRSHGYAYHRHGWNAHQGGWPKAEGVTTLGATPAGVMRALADRAAAATVAGMPATAVKLVTTAAVVAGTEVATPAGSAHTLGSHQQTQGET